MGKVVDAHLRGVVRGWRRRVELVRGGVSKGWSKGWSLRGVVRGWRRRVELEGVVELVRGGVRGGV